MCGYIKYNWGHGETAIGYIYIYTEVLYIYGKVGTNVCCIYGQGIGMHAV